MWHDFLRERPACVPQPVLPKSHLPETSENPPKKLVVHMPSTAFGHAVMQVPKEELLAKYQELY